MLKNYIVTALRVLLRNRLYSLINIGGLAIGLAVVILIGLFVRDEISYDTWIPDGENIYRIESVQHLPGRPDVVWSRSPGPVLPVLLGEYPNDIASATRVVIENYTVRQGDATMRAAVKMVDTGFFNVFDLKMVSGDRSLFSQDYNSIVISEAMAKRFFGTEDPAETALGQVLQFADGSLPMTVVAVMENIPENSHLDIDAVALFDPNRYIDQPWVAQMWFGSNVFTYLKVVNAATAKRIESDFPAFLDRHAGADRVNRNYETPSENMTLNLMPLKDIHLYSKGRFQMKTAGDITVVYSFSAIALFILAIASINFINLSVARSSLRAGEIALRKVVGATRKQIIIQFLGEVTVTVVFALIVALSIVEVALPWFNALILKVLNVSAFADPIVQMGLLGLVAIVALGAGAHPAFHLSSFRPGAILHGSKPGREKSPKLQAVLVTLQFTISIALIIATVVVYNQVNFAKNAGNSVITDNKLVIIDIGNQSLLEGPLRARVDNLSGVQATSLSARLLPLPNSWNSQVILPGQQSDKKLSVEALPGHFDTLSFFGAKLLAGRLFSADFRADLPTSEEGSLNSARSGIINETAMSQLGYANEDDAIGKSFQFKNFSNEGYAAITVVGVVRDMNMRSVRDPISPMLFLVQEEDLHFLNIELGDKDRATTLNAIDEIWQSLVPDRPIPRSFLDERFSRLYDTDARRGEFFAYFSIFAVFVSLLGLFGLSALAVERRSQEIGVRKVLGASVLDIVGLFSMQFSKPVFIANLIAWPLVAYFMNDWLTGFAYRIDLNPLYFVGPGLLVLIFALLIVAVQALRGARANPIKTLRCE